jgi:hypothetical protein
MVPNCKSSDAGYLDMLKRNHKVLPLAEKEKVLDLITEEKNHMLRLLSSRVRTNRIKHRNIKFNTVHAFRRPLEVLECIASDRRRLVYFPLDKIS